MTGQTEYGQNAAEQVLTKALEWRLTPARWEIVATILDLVSDAVADRDADALGVAIGELDEAGSGRITRIGSTPTQPIPEKVRERIIVIVERLSGNESARTPTR